MKYEQIWKKTLNDSEKVEYEFSVAQRHRVAVLVIWLIVGLMLVAVPFIGIPIMLVGVAYYWYLGLNAYAFTTKRVLIHTGWLSTKSTSINFDKIIEVSVDETFWNKAITRSGNLIIKTGGFGHDIILKNIKSPYEAKKILDRLSHHNTETIPTTHNASKSTADEITEIFKLKEQGVLTEEEFKAHKEKILAK